MATSSNNQAVQAIKAYLDNRAQSDPLFAQSYAKENKSIEECFDYYAQSMIMRRKDKSQIEHTEY